MKSIKIIFLYKGKKAIFFSTDALIALSIIFLAVLTIYPTIYYTHNEAKIKTDVLDVFSVIKIGEIDNSYVRSLIQSGEITDPDKSVLEQIGEFYVVDESKAKALATAVFSGINSIQNIGIWYDNELLFSSNSSPYESAGNVHVDRQVITGIKKGEVLRGYVAKAWLKKINEKKTSLFFRGDNICGGWRTYTWGEYCSSVQNTIKYEFNVPANASVTSAEWLVEGSWVNQYMNLTANGQSIFSGTVAYYRIFDITSSIKNETNILTLSSNSGGDDGACHIIVNYDVQDMQTYSYQKIFPFNEFSSISVLHYEKSIFIPTQISQMNVTINTTRDVSLSLRKGASTVFIAKKNPVNNNAFFSDSEIKTALSSSGISYADLGSEYFFFVVDIGKDAVGQATSLGKGSYIYIESSEIEMPYGSIDIVQPIPITSKSSLLQSTFYRNLVWKFTLPLNSIPVIADWQLGWLSTGGISSQNARGNGIVLYQSPPSPFIFAFSRLGYSPSKSSGLFRDGENNFTLSFGSNYGVSNESSYGYLIYFIKSFVSYGSTMGKAKGGTRTVTFEDNSITQIAIGDSADIWDPDDDAIDNAVERLLSQLDSNNNGKIDLIINEDSLDIDSLDISGVPYLWSTEVQVRSWS